MCPLVLSQRIKIIGYDDVFPSKSGSQCGDGVGEVGVCGSLVDLHAKQVVYVPQSLQFRGERRCWVLWQFAGCIFAGSDTVVV